MIDNKEWLIEENRELRARIAVRDSLIKVLEDQLAQARIENTGMHLELVSLRQFKSYDRRPQYAV